MPRFLLSLLAIAIPATALAQVGYDPARSPYRELRFGQFVGATTGWFGGSGGKLGLTPHGGPTLGIRYEFLGSNTVSLSLASTYASLDRAIVNPEVTHDSQISGPVSQSTVIFEGILQFNLTGGKTWNRLAPFVSAGAGLVLASRVAADSFDFRFRTKGTVTPGIGTRVFLSQRLFLRLEARAMFWQATYPSAWTLQAPADAPDEPPILFGQSRKEWIANPWFSAGLSYAFFRPF